MISFLTNLLKVKCPKCGGRKVNTLQPGAGENIRHTTKMILSALFFWPGLLFIKKQKPLNVCTECDFSWEKR